MWSVPPIDTLPFALPDIGEGEIEAVVEALRSGWVTTGPRAAAFEQEFAERLGDGVHAVALNSATAGLHLALEALGVGPGDEVLVPDWTFTATAEVVLYLGANPVFVDVDPTTLNIDLDAAASAVTERTKVVMPVHFAGLPVSASGVRDLAAKHGLQVVEDAAHSMPASSESIEVGSGASAATVFSFYATKTMTTGEGGMVVTRDEGIARRVRTMRLHGISRDIFDRYRSSAPSWHYEVVAPGYKYNLPDPAAAMGRVQLRRSGAMHARRAAIAERYLEAFADLPVQLPATCGNGDVHSWHLFVLRVLDEARVDRDEFIRRMAQEGVACSVHFIPLHLQPYWRDRYSLDPADFPVADEAFKRVVSLPAFSSMSDAQVDLVVSSVRRVLG